MMHIKKYGKSESKKKILSKVKKNLTRPNGNILGDRKDPHVLLYFVRQGKWRNIWLMFVQSSYERYDVLAIWILQVSKRQKLRTMVFFIFHTDHGNSQSAIE